MRSLNFYLQWNKKTSCSLNILIRTYLIVLHMMILGLMFPFVNFYHHPKRLGQMWLKNHLDIATRECQAVFQHLFKILNTKMIYKIFFQVRFPTLLYFYVFLIRVWEEEIKKIQKILANSVENPDVVFEHSGVKKILVHIPQTKNPIFLFMSFLRKNVRRVMLLREF